MTSLAGSVPRGDVSHSPGLFGAHPGRTFLDTGAKSFFLELRFFLTPVWKRHSWLSERGGDTSPDGQARSSALTITGGTDAMDLEQTTPLAAGQLCWRTQAGGLGICLWGCMEF